MRVQNQIKRTLSGPQGLERTRALLEESAEAHRTAIADQLCVEFGFVDARGRAQRASCLKALRQLEASGEIVLPRARTCPGKAQPRRLTEAVPAPVGVPAEVGALDGLELVRVEDAAHRGIWNELMAREHPRGFGPLVGPQLRYLIGSAHGWLGALGFAAAALRLAARDRWIGWDAEQREAQIHRVVGLNRFLIRPAVSCRNLASHILARVLHRLGADFEAVYGYRPWLVETFVEPPQTGVSLRAANWRHLGMSCGRGRQDTGHAGEETIKAIYVYELEGDWRRRLGVGPPAASTQGPLQPGEGLDGACWAENELGGAPLGDKRLSRRLVMSAQRQGEEPMRAFTAVAKDDWPAVKGYYRLIDQPSDSEVTPENILAPHRQRTVRRMQAHSTVLCIADGTDLNFTTRPQTRGLGVIGANQTGAQTLGLHQHSTLAVSTQGLPLGVLRTRFDAPEPNGKAVAPEDKKSMRWIETLRDCAALGESLPKTRLVHVVDREADFYEFFAEQQQRSNAVELVVRANYNRRLPEEKGRLFDVMRATKRRGQIQIDVPRQSARAKSSKRQARLGRQPRTAELTLRYRRIEIARDPSRRQGAREKLPVTVVHAVEESPPNDEKPIEWFVLTTLTVDSAEQAAEILRWYTLRWRIEDWHRVLQSGCKIDQLAHHSVERLERAIAIRMVIAWRVMLMTLLGREVPELPPELLFSDVELRVLGDFAQTRRRPRPRPTQLGEAVRLVAILGGYLDRKHDPPPGHQLMWHGYTKLTAMAMAYQLRDELEQ